MLKAIEKDPEKRFRKARQMVDSINEALRFADEQADRLPLPPRPANVGERPLHQVIAEREPLPAVPVKKNGGKPVGASKFQSLSKKAFFWIGLGVFATVIVLLIILAILLLGNPIL